ncbi:MAG: hypothetical protein N2Z59_07650 [Alteraurantiacibacter sp.]|nr:hypothetical protein [Alteraurantiacibacter sp.]
MKVLSDNARDIGDSWAIGRGHHDEAFLRLALVASAQALVTGDGDLLTLSAAVRSAGGCPSLTLDAFSCAYDLA